MANINVGSIWNWIEKLIYKIFHFIFAKLLKKDYTVYQHESLMQFVKFGIVGISNTVISYVIYSVSLLFFRALAVFEQADYLIAQIIAFVLSVLWSFYWNNRLVFKIKTGEKRNLWKTLFKTYVSYSFTGLFLNSILLVLWVKIFSISEFIAPIINLLVSVPLNYIINKFWAFKKEE